MGQTPTPTPTRTLGMRLSCTFVNVYTIVYHVQCTYTCVHARIPNGHPREEKRASDKSPRTSRRAERAARAAAGRLPRAPRHAAPTSGPVEFKLEETHKHIKYFAVIAIEPHLCMRLGYNRTC